MRNQYNNRTIKNKPFSTVIADEANLKEYIVVLKSAEDKLAFISEAGVIATQSQTVRQGRILRCSFDKNIINTIENDPRVESVELLPKYSVEPAGFPSNKRPPKPIGCDEQIENIETSEIQTQALDQTATIANLPDGFSTDIVIVDGIADPNHPEFATNANGSGGSRLSLINWYNALNYTNISYPSYPYNTINNPSTADNNHGSHVMGTVCGNTQGWAAKANIYNITPYTDNIFLFFDPATGFSKDLYLQAIAAWHTNKPVNPLCDTKNPTITNHSYGYSTRTFGNDVRDILSVNYRGQNYTPRRDYGGAVCVANRNSSGTITSISVTNGGANYTNPPTVSFYGGGQIEGVAELAQGSVYKITITDGGSGYTKNNPPTVTFSAPPAGGIRAVGSVVSPKFYDFNTTPPTPQVYVNPANGNEFNEIGPAGNGQVYYVELIEAGAGYVTPPTITFSTPPGGRAAQATAEIRSGFIKRLRITNGGTGYCNDSYDCVPELILSGGNPTEAALISISPILDDRTTSDTGAILDGVYEPYIQSVYYPSSKKHEFYFAGGGNYQSQPVVSFYGGNRFNDDGTITGTKPVAYAVLGTGANANSIASIVLERQGSGYTSAPTIVLTDGGGFTIDELKNFGIVPYTFSDYWGDINGRSFIRSIPYRYPVIDEDITSLINAGVIVVAAAGNAYYKIDLPGGQDYNNSFRMSEAPVSGKGDASILAWNENITTDYYNRGSSPGAAPGVICVGAAGVGSPEYKTDFSNTGPRVDVYAPGDYINSSVNKTIEDSEHGVPDPRNSNYSITKWSGTSMASPQVAGMIACYAQSNRNINQNTARDFIINNAKPTLNDGTGYLSLQGGANRYAFMPNINTQ